MTGLSERIERRLFKAINNGASKKNIQERVKAEKKELKTLYKKMDVDFSSDMLSVMEEVIDYCSLYKVFKNYLSLKEIKELILGTYDEAMSEFDDDYWRSINNEMFSKKNIDEIREAAMKSQESIHTEDYLVYFVEGYEGVTFGNNTKRCPIHILCTKADIYEFLETLCQIDYVRSKYMKSGLKREKCLCHPMDDMCTFRWTNMA